MSVYSDKCLTEEAVLSLTHKSSVYTVIDSLLLHIEHFSNNILVCVTGITMQLECTN